MNLAQLFAFFAVKHNYISSLLTGLLNFAGHNVEYIGQKAIINKPVVDMSSGFPTCKNSPASGQETICRRANQGLYNELVDCMMVVADMIKIDANKIVYGYDEQGNPYSTFWANKDAFVLLKNVNPLLVSMIPCMKNVQQPKLCLILPWNSYSVGTYFVRIPTKDTDLSYAVFVPHFAENTFAIEYVSKEKALFVEERSEQQMRLLFVDILYTLIEYAAYEKSHGVIPYVWGGCSFITANAKDDFLYTDGAWHRPYDNQIYAGYDCSGLIWRIAQSVGIQFPWKVSKIISEQCRPIDNSEMLEEGDIIWFAGHVMVVADIEHNMLIEAAGYGNGYGCVHCVSLAERFDGINTYADLMDVCVHQHPVTLLNATGQQVKQVFVKLLKLTPPYSQEQ